MRCIYFVSNATTKATDLYNMWAKNKVLAKDVIIHSHIVSASEHNILGLMIIVFFDERIHTDWAPKELCPNMERATRGNE